MARTVYYVAVSADGFIATRDGDVAWLEPFNSPELGYQTFLAKVEAVVLGRTTYEQSLTFGPWPYPGREGLIVTSRAQTKLPPKTRAVAPDELPAALAGLGARARGDVWVVGGGKTARACLDAEFLDEIELYVIPRLLGEGVPLFSPRDAQVPLRLLATRTFPSGVVQLRYSIERPPRRAFGAPSLRRPR